MTSGSLISDSMVSSALTSDSLTYAVYSALLDQHYDRGVREPLVLLGETVDRSDEVTIDHRLAVVLQTALGPLSPEILDSWAQLPSEPAVLGREFSTRRSVEIMTRAQRDSIFSFCPGGWDVFAGIYPRTRGYVTLSRAVSDPSKTQALVYTEEYCGMWCAEGTFVYLEKEDDVWKIRRKLTLWVS